MSQTHVSARQEAGSPHPTLELSGEHLRCPVRASAGRGWADEWSAVACPLFGV